MDENDKIRIKANYEFIVENLLVTDIQDRLTQEFLLSEENLEDLGRVNSFQRVRDLLRLLTKSKNRDCYRILCVALKDKGYDHIITQLDLTDIAKFKEKLAIEEKHSQEQVEKLQQQLWMQTEMLLSLKKDMDRLKSENVARQQKEEEFCHYTDLESRMMEKGISSKNVLTSLIDFVDSGGFDSKGKAYQSEGHNENGSIAKAGKTNNVLDIAKKLARDVIVYTVQKKNNISTCRPPDKYSALMRNITDQLNEKNEECFLHLVSELNLDKCRGFSAIHQVAEAMFNEDGKKTYNWGRVSTLYAFAGWMAVKSVQNPQDAESLDRIVSPLVHLIGSFIESNVSEWIQEVGGWDNFQEWTMAGGREEERSIWPYLVLGTLTGVAMSTLFGN